MLGRFRTAPWRQGGVWLRGIGLVLLLLVAFLPLPSLVLVAIASVGLIAFLLGAWIWLVRDEGTWIRR